MRVSSANMITLRNDELKTAVFCKNLLETKFGKDTVKYPFLIHLQSVCHVEIGNFLTSADIQLNNTSNERSGFTDHDFNNEKLKKNNFRVPLGVPGLGEHESEHKKYLQ